MLKFILGFIFVVLTTFYYVLTFEHNPTSQIFLSISTFLFAIFTGFFIARQGRRYSSIREQITYFDGEINAIYRHFGHLGTAAQKDAKNIIKKHYQTILRHKAWDYHFVHKSNTITSLHELSEKTTKGKNLDSLKNLSLQRILYGLEKLQVVRKSMVALQKERIPTFQWVIIYFLALILFLTLSTIPSGFSFLGALLKGSFGTLVIAVLILLHKFDTLNFFEHTIGENSAKDVLNILAGKK